MATRVHTEAIAGINKVVTWTGLLNGDVGDGVAYGDWTDKTMQVSGTFGASGNVNIEGSLDDGANWFVLHDPQGNNLAITAAKMEMIAENALLVRPHVTGGDGTTTLVVVVAGAKNV